MPAKVRGLYRCRAFLAPLLIAAIMFLGMGCGTSSLKSYQAFLQNPSRAGANNNDWMVEHDLFSGKAQQGKEAWEED